MIDYFISNFNWPTFIFTMALFFIFTNAVALIVNTVVLRKARKRVKSADAKHEDLKAQFKAKQDELNKLLGKKETKQ